MSSSGMGLVTSAQEVLIQKFFESLRVAPHNMLPLGRHEHFSSSDTPSLFYRFNCDSLPLKYSKTELREIRKLLTCIEQFLHTHQGNVAPLRRYIIKLLEESEYATLMSELGLIWLYLKEEHELPCEIDFQSDWQQKLHSHLLYLQGGRHPQLPSGECEFLLRSITDLIIDATTGLNRGGIIASIQLLEGPLGSYIKDEHRVQILNVLKQALEDPEFSFWLALPVEMATISQEMRWLITIDLKLPFDQPVSEHHVRLAAFLTLLKNLRQSGYQNCFAIAPLLFMIHTSPVLVYRKCLELIQTGKLSPEVGIEIPLLPLVFSRLIRDKQLGVQLTQEEVERSGPLQTILQALGNPPLDFPYGNPLFLYEILDLATISSSDLITTFAAAMLHAYQCGVLQQMLLSSIEFLEVNQSQVVQIGSQARPVKARLIAFFLESLKTQLQSIFHDFIYSAECQSFIQSFEAKLTSTLWLQNYSASVEQEGESIVIYIDEREVTLPSFIGNREALGQEVAYCRRLVYLEGENLTPIHTLDELQKFLLNTASDVYEQKLRRGEARPSEQNFLFIQAFLRSSIFPEALFPFLANLNPEFGLTPKDYQESRLVLFCHDGGCGYKAPLRMLGAEETTNQWWESDSSSQNVFQLLTYLYEQKKDFLFSQQPLLATSFAHSFLLHPHLFSPLWEVDPTAALRVFSSLSVERLLKIELKPEKFRAILLQVFSAEWVDSQFSFGGSLTVQGGIDLIKHYFPPEHHLSLLLELEMELMRTPYDHIPWDLLPTLVAPFLSQSQQEGLAADLADDFSSKQEIHPGEIAVRLQFRLSELGHFFPKVKIENLICEQLQLPITWTLGDLNYSDQTEFPDHQVLVFKVLLDKSQRLFIRKGNILSPLSTRHHNSLKLLHLTYLPPETT